MSSRTSNKFEAVIEDVTEADYRAYFDSSVFRVWHLCGKERTFKIIRCARLQSTFKGEVRKQPLLYLVDRRGIEQLPLALNKTNAKTIAQLYGTNPHLWAGRTITLYPTTTDVGGKTEECIRVRPWVPGSKSAPNKQGANVIRSPRLPEPPEHYDGELIDHEDDLRDSARGHFDTEGE